MKIRHKPLRRAVVRLLKEIEEKGGEPLTANGIWNTLHQRKVLSQSYLQTPRVLGQLLPRTRGIGVNRKQGHYQTNGDSYVADTYYLENEEAFLEWIG
jgi:1-acyl-sn-glycerol-3-phosphate acyltransferase